MNLKLCFVCRRKGVHPYMQCISGGRYPLSLDKSFSLMYFWLNVYPCFLEAWLTNLLFQVSSLISRYRLTLKCHPHIVFPALTGSSKGCDCPSLHSGQARQPAGRKTEIKTTPMNTAPSLPAVKPKLSLDIESCLLRDKMDDSGMGTTALENA